MINILFSDIPVSVTIGLDHYSFDVAKGQIFNGIIGIVQGLHSIHFQHGGVRYGYWIHQSNDYYVQYNGDSETFELKIEEDTVKYENILNSFKQRGTVVAYPKIQEDDTWTPLTKYIKWDQIVRITQSNSSVIFVDSSMTTRDENETLKTVLKNGPVKGNDDDDDDDDPRSENNNERYLEYTPIKFKSREAIRRGHEMEDYIDKTYYFNEIIVNKCYNGRLDLYYSELQFAYMNTLLFGNYGSSLQWHSMIEVICFAKEIRNGDSTDNSSINIIDQILSQQLTVLPEEYVEMLLNEDMWYNCLLDSYQGPKLLRTGELMKRKLPQIFERPKINNMVNDDIDRREEEDYVGEDEQVMLPPIDSDNEDEDGPVVVERLIYR